VGFSVPTNNLEDISISNKNNLIILTVANKPRTGAPPGRKTYITTMYVKKLLSVVTFEPDLKSMKKNMDHRRPAYPRDLPPISSGACEWSGWSCVALRATEKLISSG
jgi:hypothetical protein